MAEKYEVPRDASMAFSRGKRQFSAGIHRQARPGDPALRAVYNLGVIDVEYALLDLEGAEAALDLLDDAERERAARFLRPHARSRFVKTRNALRRELGHRLQIAPRNVRFVYGPQGKPELADGPVTFNVAHAGRLALLCFAHGAGVGADIERVRPIANPLPIAHRLFGGVVPRSPEEFFRLWARHEARVKCVGDRNSTRLNSSHLGNSYAVFCLNNTSHTH